MTRSPALRKPKMTKWPGRMVIVGLLGAGLVARAQEPEAKSTPPVPPPKDTKTAIAQGRILAAGRLAKADLQRTANKDANALYQAAEVAVMQGNESLALSRFRAFVDLSSEKTPRMRRALDYVLGKGVYVDGLAKRIKLFGPDEGTWKSGIAFMERSFRDDIPEEAVRMAELLVPAFKTESDKMDLLARRIADHAGYIGTDESLHQRLGKLAPAMQVTDMYQFQRFLDTCWPKLPVEERIDALMGVQKTLKRPLPSGQFKWFAGLKELPEAKRIPAGRAFLALEPTYRDKGTELNYRSYVMRLLDSPTVFHVEKQEIVNDAQIQERISTLAAKLKTRPDVRTQLSDPLRYTSSNYLGEAGKAAYAALLQKHVGLLHPDRFRDLLTLTEGKQFAAQLGQWAQGKPAMSTAGLKYHLLDWYTKREDKAGLIAAAREALIAKTGFWDAKHIATHFMGSALPSIDEKVAVLNAVHAKEGSSDALQKLVAAAEKQDKALLEHAGFKTLKAAVAKPKPAADPARVAYLAMLGIKRNQHKPEAAVYATADAFLNAYKGKIPGSAQGAANTEEYLANRVLEQHLQHALHSKTEMERAALLWGVRITSTGSDIEYLLRRAHEHGHRSGLWPAAKVYAGLVKKGQPLSKDTASRLADLCPKDEAVSLFDGMYDKLGDTALAWVNRHMHHYDQPQNRWPTAFYQGELVKVMAVPGTTFSRTDLAGSLERLASFSNAEAPAPEALVTKLTSQLVARSPHSLDRLALARGHVAFSRSGTHVAARRWFDGLMKSLAPRPAVDRANVALAVAGWGEQRNTTNRTHILMGVAKPIIDKIPSHDRGPITIDYQMMGQCAALRSDPDETRKAAGAAFYLQMAELAITDGRVGGDPGHIGRNLCDGMVSMIQRADWPKVLQALDAYTAAAVYQSDWKSCRSYLVAPVVKELEAQEAYEPLFAFAGMMQARVRNGRDEAVKELVAIKGRAAREIPGLLPVDKSDPTYDLHLAAQLLGMGNETRAWELSQPKLALLRERWLSMDPDYVAWNVDQMRKQKLYKPALDFAFTVLMKEMDFHPEMMARVSLTKGDIYRDQENYQAARIEYQGLIDSSRYKKTPAGLDARYRLIDLMIQTKDYAGADARLQRLVDAGTLREQAEAYFLYAKMAFEQQEYALSRDHLRDVFRREHGHVPARLLEGELRLLLPRGLASTEVPIGRLDLQTVAVPGRELTLKLQDSNLSIARGGKAIPVVVTTTKGGDEEHIKLLVSPDDETLFIGTIATHLGQAKKNNLMLEVSGDEHVSYQMEPAFQKANDLDYPPKLLLIKSDAELVASAGQILTREERDRVEMERRLAQSREWDQNAWQRQRRDTLVRPGSPIYVQVTDLDRDVSAQPDKVLVDLETSSGDLLEGFALTETEPHTGVFTAEVPTAVPYPVATASDTEEGKDANTTINNTRPDPWISVADGELGKWIEVDTMTSHGVKSAAIETADVENIRRVRLLGSLAEGLGLLGEFPESEEAATGGLLMEMAGGSQHRYEDMRGALRRRIAHTAVLPQPSFFRPDTEVGKRNAWYVTRLSGTFWLPENRLLSLKFLQKETPHNWQYAHVFIDGDYAMGGLIRGDVLQHSVKRFLTKGAHTLEVLFRDHWSESGMVIGYQKEDGTYEAMPAEWFSTKDNPELAALLKPRAVITRTETGFAAELAEPERLRRLRWVFDDFDGQALSVSGVRVTDADDKVVIPSAHDFSMGRENRVLEIAAGDQVEISYADEQRLDPDNPVLSANLGASFANATAQLAYEVIVLDANGDPISTYTKARRARSGDQLMLIVTDYDEDQTDERDTIEVSVETSSGESLTLKALETRTVQHYYGRDEHAGEFMQTLKFGDVTQGNTIKLSTGDTVRVSYVDRENTDPGVPVARTHTVTAADGIAPELNVFRTRVQQIEDRSPRALLKADRLRRQGMPEENIKIYTELVTGEPALTLPGETSAVPVSARAPILIEALNPSAALHSGSRCKVIAVAESERKAAEAEGREPVSATVPLVLDDITQVARRKGYPVRLSGRVQQQSEALLLEGRFAGVLRLQLGSPGDEVDDRVSPDEAGFGVRDTRNQFGDDEERFRVPTLVVAGNDRVQLSIQDEDGNVLAGRDVQLRSDAEIALMDRSFTTPVEAVHLGQKFYVRVTDPDRDVSDERESVEVSVSTEGGDAMSLSLQETLPHSGVFSGTVEPAFVTKDAQGAPVPPNPADDVLNVSFGDAVTFGYEDPVSLSATGTTNVTVVGKIYRGADGRLASFTKQFKDPEMAVKTRFLLAEALFEMAKDHRKLNREEQSAEEIAEGKRILEEAMRDYPDTSLVAQGEFLLANLAQELESYQEAIGRYSRVISSWPDSEYASRSQFKKAICLEKMDHYDQACEAYVKLTYLYPNSPLVADATVRMGNYYYTHEKYRTAGRIFERFQERHAEHELAAKALFLAGQSYMKMENEREEGLTRDYTDAVIAFGRLVEAYPDDKSIRPEAMYWLADSHFRNRNHVKAYQTFKKLTWDYPSTKWAKIARGRLTEEVFARIEDE